jgi:hypothetical protein
VPWEKLRRKTFAPAKAKLLIISYEFEAGPMVAKIFVFLKGK